MRLATTAALVTVLVAILAAPLSASTPGGSGSPACLRGSWVASQAETNRVIRALVPNFPAEARGRLYMIFRDGAFQYGSRQLVYTATFGDVTMIARGQFFTLAPYTARPGVFTTGAGEVTTEWGKMTGIKDGKTYTVDGPPTSTRRTPGGPTPYRCSRGTLQVKLPRFASLEWITLRRGTP
ncbi:MAG: hypothetical protein ACRC50_02035 [Gaiella sp.]